jgi:hypothetical protein
VVQYPSSHYNYNYKLKFFDFRCLLPCLSEYLILMWLIVSSSIRPSATSWWLPAGAFMWINILRKVLLGRFYETSFRPKKLRTYSTKLTSFFWVGAWIDFDLLDRVDFY